jgi:hypothetical protein
MADYVVIAISPALIMALVGSLVFFLLRVFYQGEYQERLHWVMACAPYPNSSSMERLP